MSDWMIAVLVTALCLALVAMIALYVLGLTAHRADLQIWRDDDRQE